VAVRVSGVSLATALACSALLSCSGETERGQNVPEGECQALCAAFADARCVWPPQSDSRDPLLTFTLGDTCMGSCTTPKFAPTGTHCAGGTRDAFSACLAKNASNLVCEQDQPPRVSGCDSQAVALAEECGICFELPSLEPGSCPSDTPARFYCSQSGQENMNYAEPFDYPVCQAAEPGYWCCPPKYWKTSP
jgi:hypothetical protein